MVAVPSANAAASADAGVLANTHLSNRNSDKCLVAQNKGENSPAFQYDCVGDFADQRWDFQDIRNGWYQVYNEHAKKCLTVHTNGNEAKAVAYTCHVWDSQQWRSEMVSDHEFLLRHRASGKCLIVRGFENGNQAVLHTCDKRFDDQIWSAGYMT